MIRLAVSNTGNFLTMNHKPFFYLADTVWSVFSNASLDEWEEYLAYRRMQGFNILQINVLYQWDAVEEGRSIYPFPRKENGSFDFGKPVADYFDRAQTMLDMAVSCGFTPALVLLWCNFVPGTWASRRAPEQVMPRETVRPYVEYALERFSRFDPIYIISGDTDLDTEEASDYYRIVLDTIEEMSPRSLVTMHLAGSRFPTERFIQHKKLDFYMFQSGHGFAEEEIPYARNPALMSEKFVRLAVKKPVINGEPCYEGINSYEGERFSAAQVRKAIWKSLLSGASAGTAYGAHGVWSWHRKADMGKAQGLDPFDWRIALRFDGAWDAVYAKWVFETYNLFGVEPVDREKTGNDRVCVSSSRNGDRMAVYIPYSMDVELPVDLTGYHCTMLHLEKRNAISPEVETSNGRSCIRMSPFNSDALFIAWRE